MVMGTTAKLKYCNSFGKCTILKCCACMFQVNHNTPLRATLAARTQFYKIKVEMKLVQYFKSTALQL